MADPTREKKYSAVGRGAKLLKKKCQSFFPASDAVAIAAAGYGVPAVAFVSLHHTLGSPADAHVHREQRCEHLEQPRTADACPRGPRPAAQGLQGMHDALVKQ